MSAGLLQGNDGNVQVAIQPVESVPGNSTIDKVLNPVTNSVEFNNHEQNDRREDAIENCTVSHPIININIQLQLPECDNTDTYDRLFKSLRKNLLTPSSADE